MCKELLECLDAGAKVNVIGEILGIFYLHEKSAIKNVTTITESKLIQRVRP